jgi:uncharacterized protein
MIVIRRISQTSILVNNEDYENSIVLTADEVLGAWDNTPVDDLTETHFEGVFETGPEIVLIGTGGSNVFAPRELTFAFARRGIGLEVMDTAAAARTFNVLVNERRKVTAVLYL